MDKATEQDVAAINAEVNAFYQQFTRSMLNLFGKVSFKRFNEFIDRLWFNKNYSFIIFEISRIYVLSKNLLELQL